MGTARVVLRRSRNALFERHLLEQVARSADTVHNEQHVADVHGDVAADRRVEGDVAHRRTPRAVEIDAHQFAVGVDDRRTGVAARNVEIRQKSDRQFAPPVGIVSLSRFI